MQPLPCSRILLLFLVSQKVRCSLWLWYGKHSTARAGRDPLHQLGMSTQTSTGSNPEMSGKSKKGIGKKKRSLASTLVPENVNFAETKTALRPFSAAPPVFRPRAPTWFGHRHCPKPLRFAQKRACGDILGATMSLLQGKPLHEPARAQLDSASSIVQSIESFRVAARGAARSCRRCPAAPGSPDVSAAWPCASPGATPPRSRLWPTRPRPHERHRQPRPWQAVKDWLP